MPPSANFKSAFQQRTRAFIAPLLLSTLLQLRAMAAADFLSQVDFVRELDAGGWCTNADCWSAPAAQATHYAARERVVCPALTRVHMQSSSVLARLALQERITRRHDLRATAGSQELPLAYTNSASPTWQQLAMQWFTFAHNSTASDTLCAQDEHIGTRRTILRANDAELTINNTVVFGSRNKIYGANNLIIGDYNSVFGDGNRARGTDNFLRGRACTNHDEGGYGQVQGGGSCTIRVSPRCSRLALSSRTAIKRSVLSDDANWVSSDSDVERADAQSEAALRKAHSTPRRKTAEQRRRRAQLTATAVDADSPPASERSVKKKKTKKKSRRKKKTLE